MPHGVQHGVVAIDQQAHSVGVVGLRIAPILEFNLVRLWLLGGYTGLGGAVAQIWGARTSACRWERQVWQQLQLRYARWSLMALLVGRPAIVGLKAVHIWKLFEASVTSHRPGSSCSQGIAWSPICCS